ncbi:hypothetical protein KC887_02700 [Candidatus Kaiserbacteria bacterium]|nr:hypothetical protein [Candidatus Kaiserbacteria bacterium]
MDNVSRIKTKLLLLSAAFCLLFLLLAWGTAVGGEITNIYLPLVGNGERETGGPHPWPHPTITPVSTPEHGGYDPLPRATITPTAGAYP